ncbi:hypothetical protein Bca101_063123 [Brassica carinata]
METQPRNLPGDLPTITTGRNTRSKTSENGKDNALLPIPTDLVFEIFSRLPVKSIAICRCVSKIWDSLLRRQCFTELFLSRSCARPPRLLLVYQEGGELFFSSAPQPDVNASDPVVTATHHSKLSIDAYVPGGAFEISGLEHGLVGLSNNWLTWNRNFPSHLICNPSTGQLLPLTKVNTRGVMWTSVFGFDPIDEQVKVLSMSGGGYGLTNQVMTSGTGTTLSWRMINCGSLLSYYPHVGGRCINGVLYSTAFEVSTKTRMLVCFDVRSEKLSFMKDEKFFFERTMVNYNGKLGLLRFEEGVSGDESSKSVSMWVLEDIGKEEWSEHVYVLPALWKDIVGSAKLSFVGMTSRDEIVMQSKGFPPRPFHLFYFDTVSNTIVRVEIQGMDHVSEFNKIHIFLDHVENVKLM